MTEYKMHDTIPKCLEWARFHRRAARDCACPASLMYHDIQRRYAVRCGWELRRPIRRAA